MLFSKMFKTKKRGKNAESFRVFHHFIHERSGFYGMTKQGFRGFWMLLVQGEKNKCRRIPLPERDQGFEEHTSQRT